MEALQRVLFLIRSKVEKIYLPLARHARPLLTLRQAQFKGLRETSFLQENRELWYFLYVAQRVLAVTDHLLQSG